MVITFAPSRGSVRWWHDDVRFLGMHIYFCILLSQKMPFCILSLTSLYTNMNCKRQLIYVSLSRYAFLAYFGVHFICLACYNWNSRRITYLYNPILHLTHWGRVTHICVSKLTIIGSDNGFSPGRRQAIIWANAGILLIGPLGTNFSEILIGIQTFSFKKMHLKMSSAKWRPFCLGLNVLTAAIFWHLKLSLGSILLGFLYWYRLA